MTASTSGRLTLPARVALLRGADECVRPYTILETRGLVACTTAGGGRWLPPYTTDALASRRWRFRC